MGFLNKVFGRQNDIASTLVNVQNNIFNIYGIQKPTDAQKVKASVYICIASMAIFNIVRNDDSKFLLINKLVEASGDLTKPLHLRVWDLANSEDELQELLSSFPEHIKVEESTILNGLAAFEALYSTKGERLMTTILTLSRTGSDITNDVVDYASMVVANELFRDIEPSRRLMDISLQFMKFVMEFTSKAEGDL